MTGKQALKLAIQANNEEFNTEKLSMDKCTGSFSGGFHFIVEGERFAYCNDNGKQVISKIKGWSRVPAVVIS